MDERLVEAALGLVEESYSFDRLSVDAVCRRARASKASFYRRWPDRESFILATLDRLRPAPLARGETGSLRDDLIAILRSMFGFDLRRTRIVNAALVAEGRRNPGLKQRYIAEIVQPRRRALTDRLDHAAAAGALPADTDVYALHELLTAPVLKQVMMADPDESVADDFIERLVDQALRGGEPRQATAAQTSKNR